MNIKRIFFSVLLPLLALPLSSKAQILPSILPACDPAAAPNTPAGCGIPDFILLLKNVISYLTIISIPLGIIIAAWGGFVMMTAGGNVGTEKSPSRFNKGKTIRIF